MVGKIIQFAETRAYKIVLFSLVGFAALFLILGGFFALTTGGIDPVSMSITAPGVTSQVGNVVHMDVVARETVIQVNTEPGNLTNRPIQFHIDRGAAFIEPISNIQSGGYAAIRLRTVQAGPQAGLPVFFTQANAYEPVVIFVSAGAGLGTMTLHIQIRLSQSEVSFDSVLERNFGFGWQPNWQRVSEMSAADFRDGNQYRVRSSLRLFGVEVRNSLIASDRNNLFWEACMDSFQNTGIIILTPESGFSILDALNPAGNIPEWALIERGEFRFEIGTSFMGTSASPAFRFVDFFTLRIVE